MARSDEGGTGLPRINFPLETLTLGGTYGNELLTAKGTFGLVDAGAYVYALFPFVSANHAGQKKNHMALPLVLAHAFLLPSVRFPARLEFFAA
jgi:hypothetical protein